jgi:hypothetical protein
MDKHDNPVHRPRSLIPTRYIEFYARGYRFAPGINSTLSDAKYER